MKAAVVGRNEIPSCHGGLENLDTEHRYWIEDVDGVVPKDLVGTFFRNGPGRQRIGATPYGHWFDGDGMIAQFTFTGDRVHFANRYVRTPKYLEETAAQRIRYRGFGTQIPGGLRANFLKMPANPANTSIVYHAEMLLALNEGGHPWQLEPGSLETIGEFDYHGALSQNQVFSAHGKVHPRTGDYINFGAGLDGMGLRGPKPCIHVYRIERSGKLTRKGKVAIDRFPFCHDFALTDRYAVFFVGSIVMSGMLGAIAGFRSLADNIGFDRSLPMRIAVMDLDTLKIVREFEIEPGAIIHFGNAFDEDGEIVIDAMYTDNFDANNTLNDVFDRSGRFGGGVYNRYRLDMPSGAVRCERVCEHESEFPTINPAFTGRRNDVTYTACSVPNGADSFFNAIQRITFDGNSTLVTLPPGQYGSEPLFAPATNACKEDDGYVLEVVYDAYEHKSNLQVLRADDPTERVCRLGLTHHLPHQFHGHFTPHVFVQ